MRRKGRTMSLVLIVMLILWNIYGFDPWSDVCKAAAKKVSDYEGLKKALASTEEMEITLEKDIDITGEISVQGKKHLYGDGHRLRRFCRDKNAFGGTLLSVEKGDLVLENVTISGSGSSQYAQSGLYGRLLDIQEGSAAIKENVILCDNKCGKTNSDGGGAVRIEKQGTLVLDGGVIKGNQNVTGGAGVRVEKGGSLIVKQGSIQGNQTVGIGAVEGFDGRGGAIYSQGKVKISGGKITGNKAAGYVHKGTIYGGAGGAFYGGVSSSLQITGGTIGSNEADTGQELYLEGGICQMSGGPDVASVYLCTGAVITVKGKLSGKKSITLIPEKYKEGICLVKTSGTKGFVLEKKNSFTLQLKGNGLYLKKKSKSVNSVTPTPTAASKSSKKKAKYKTVSPTPAPDSAATSVPAHTKRKKRSPVIRKVAERYFFQWEIKDYSEKKWEEELIKKCQIDFGDYSEKKVEYRWDWNGLLSNQTGSYLVKLSLTGGTSAEIPITVVEDRVLETVSDEFVTYITFCPVEDTEEEEEIWCFSTSDISAAKEYMEGTNNPFSQKTNQTFLSLFQMCRQGGLVGESK